MQDARPGFIIKFLKRSLIEKFIEHELPTASLQSSTVSLYPSKTADWQSKARVQ